MFEKNMGDNVNQNEGCRKKEILGFSQNDMFSMLFAFSTGTLHRKVLDFLGWIEIFMVSM